MNSIPIAGTMEADEPDDYLELRDPAVKKIIAASHRDYLAGKTRDARELLAEVTAAKPKKSTRAPKR